MIEELISRTFALRNAAQLAHWRAKGPGSYAKHETLGALYDGVISKLDDIIEAYQGMTGKPVGVVKLTAQDTQRDCLAMIEADCAWITENREEIAEDNPAIENMLDDLCALYLKTTYKLKFLA